MLENERTSKTIEFSNEIIIKDFNLEAKLNDIIVITNTADLPLLYVIKENDDRNKFYNDVVLTNNTNDLIIDNEFIELLDNNGQVKVSNPTSTALQSTNFTNIKSCVKNIFKTSKTDINKELGPCLVNQLFFIRLDVHTEDNKLMIKELTERGSLYYHDLKRQLRKTPIYQNLQLSNIFNWLDYIYLICITCIDKAFEPHSTSSALVRFINYLTGRIRLYKYYK